jgi:catechol 2,3-dioxygenase-like lactoylglutathione lyase family enzyme
MIVVDDVPAASRWFQDVLGVTSGHGGPEYEMLMDGDELVAQLHRWDVHDHAHLGDREDESRGNGVLLWFMSDDFDGVVERVRARGVEVLEGPLVNGRQREVWIRGPEGYRVVVASPRNL